MRKCGLISVLLVMLCGCSWLESFYAPSKGGSEAQRVSKAVGDLPYGWAVQGAIALGGVLFGGTATHVHHTRKNKKKAAPPAAPVA